MPLYIATTEDGFLTDQTRERLAREITKIHMTIMKVPATFVRIAFVSYPKGSGYTAGERASTAALNCILRSGHTPEEKETVLKQLWNAFQSVTGIATDQLAISLQEIPSSNAMEMGLIMPTVGHE